MTIIGISAFQGCTSLTSIDIPNSVTTIGWDAISRTGLTSIVIPNSVKIIDGWSFCLNYNLTSVTIGNSVTSIKEGAFAGCGALKSVKVDWGSPISITTDVFSFWPNSISDVTLTVPAGTSENYRAAEVWKEFNIVEEEVSFIPSTTEAVFVWKFVPSAATYTLTICSDETCSNVLYTYIFDSTGKLVEMRSSSNITADNSDVYSYTIKNLLAGTTYYYSLIAKDASNGILKEEQGNFTTLQPSQLISLFNDASGLGIYPNPVFESFRINGITENTLITIVDIAGKIVLKQTIIPDEMVSIGHLQSGVYFVNIKGETVKIIKQ